MPFPSVRIITAKYFSIDVVIVSNIGKLVVVVQKSCKHAGCIGVYLNVEKA